MKQRTILSTLLFCALLLAGCGTAAQTPDATVSITSGGETVDFSPYISLKDGSVQVGARGLNITRISTSS